MPALQRSEFALALNQVANERGVDVSVVMETVRNAILAAYKKDNPDIEIEEYTAELDQNTGEAKILIDGKNVTPPGFGRIAAQTAKQVILQKIREKEKEAIFSDYKMRMNTIVNGMVLRFAGPNVIVDVGKTEAIMPSSEQIQSERYHLNQRIAVYLVEIKEGLKGEELIVSRANNGLLEGLFKREVPEVAQGSVTIKAIAREAGSRSKIAVYSSQSGIDPVGSCVGQKGVRVQAIIQEFGGLEKIDIIQWQENPKDFIGQSLSPAKNVRVEIDEAAKTAHVFVPHEELSLAIGRDGQNVRLASKLTGYRIEIEGEGGIVESPSSPASDDAQVKNRKGADQLAHADGDVQLSEEKPNDDPASLSQIQTPQVDKNLEEETKSNLDSPSDDQSPSASEADSSQEEDK
ncbi:MAG: transcription termination factor NusA [Patescibacteria group bacterium]